MADRARIEEASRKKGREISPELIEEILGALGVGAIKAISGISNLGVRLGGKQLVKKEAFSGLKNIVNPDRLSKSDLAAVKSRANLNRAASVSEEGFRRNIGGKRPPDAELEALALQKQGAQRVKRPNAIRELQSPTAQNIRREEMIKQLTKLTADFLLKRKSGASKDELKKILEEIARLTE